MSHLFFFTVWLKWTCSSSLMEVFISSEPRVAWNHIISILVWTWRLYSFWIFWTGKASRAHSSSGLVWFQCLCFLHWLLCHGERVSICYYYLLIIWRENKWIHTFPRGNLLYVKCKQPQVAKFISYNDNRGQVGRGRRIHQLHLCRGVRPPPPNECPWYNTKQSSNAGALRNAEHPFIVIAPRSGNIS